MSDADFYQGFACAVGSLARDHMQPGMALDIMKINGVTISDLENAGADDFDLNLIREEARPSD